VVSHRPDRDAGDTGVTKTLLLVADTDAGGALGSTEPTSDAEEVHVVGVSPSKHLSGDAGDASGSREPTGDAEEVHVVGSPNSKQLSGDAGNDSKESKQLAASAKTNGTRSLGTRISKISGAITCVHKAVRLPKIS